MRYPISEKLEIIRLLERSHLPVRRSLDKLGIAKTTFYRWYDRYLAFGLSGLEGRTSGPGRVWNRIPDDVRQQIVDLALDEPELSPRELAVRFTDTKGYFVSEASVYRLLKAHDLITSPAFVVIKAADEFRDKTTAPNQLWQTDFTYLKVIGWGWFYLSTILDDYSRYIIAWKLCTTMKADDVTLNAALFDTGRPVLVAPPAGGDAPSKPFSADGHVAVSWNGSAPTARAVGSAMGLIAKTDKVTVLTAASDQTSAPRAPELAAYLEWHRIVPEIRTFTSDGGPSIGKALLAECSSLGVDLLMMGAYAHSRVRQLILGGLTRHVLEHAALPLFMAH